MSPLDTLLATVPSFVVFKTGCPYCTDAMELLDRRQIVYTRLDRTRHRDLDAEITARTGHRTYPKIYLDRGFVGGYTELAERLGERTAL